MYLGTRQINKRIVSEIESIKEEIGYFMDYEIGMTFHMLIEKLLNEVGEFGQINVFEYAINLDFKDPKIDQAQIGMIIPRPRNAYQVGSYIIYAEQSITYTCYNTLPLIIIQT